MRCFDGHCDTLARCMTTGEGLRQNGGHVDLARCAALGQHAQIFAVFADSSKTSAPLYTVAQRQHALLERECARNADLVRRCRTARDARPSRPADRSNVGYPSSTTPDNIRRGLCAQYNLLLNAYHLR